MPGQQHHGEQDTHSFWHQRAWDLVGETENERSNYRWLKRDYVLTGKAKTTVEVHYRGSDV